MSRNHHPKDKSLTGRERRALRLELKHQAAEDRVRARVGTASLAGRASGYQEGRSEALQHGAVFLGGKGSYVLPERESGEHYLNEPPHGSSRTIEAYLYAPSRAMFTAASTSPFATAHRIRLVATRWCIEQAGDDGERTRLVWFNLEPEHEGVRVQARPLAYKAISCMQVAQCTLDEAQRSVDIAIREAHRRGEVGLPLWEILPVGLTPHSLPLYHQTYQQICDGLEYLEEWLGIVAPKAAPLTPDDDTVPGINSVW